MNSIEEDIEEARNIVYRTSDQSIIDLVKRLIKKLEIIRNGKDINIHESL